MRNTIPQTALRCTQQRTHNHQHRRKYTYTCITPTQRVFLVHFSFSAVHFHSLWFFKQIFIFVTLWYIIDTRITSIRSHDFNGLYCTKFLKVSNRCFADVTNEPSLIGSTQNCIHYKWMKWVRALPPSSIIPRQMNTHIHTHTRRIHQWLTP